jgi:hypothetical protein
VEGNCPLFVNVRGSRLRVGSLAEHGPEWRHLRLLRSRLSPSTTPVHLQATTTTTSNAGQVRRRSRRRRPHSAPTEVTALESRAGSGAATK